MSGFGLHDRFGLDHKQRNGLALDILLARSLDKPKHVDRVAGVFTDLYVNLRVFIEFDLPAQQFLYLLDGAPANGDHRPGQRVIDRAVVQDRVVTGSFTRVLQIYKKHVTDADLVNLRRRDRRCARAPGDLERFRSDRGRRGLCWVLAAGFCAPVLFWAGAAAAAPLSAWSAF